MTHHPADGGGFDGTLSGIFDALDPDDFADPQLLSAKLAPVAGAFAGAFDLEEFVDRCVRQTEDTFAHINPAGASGQPAPTAVLACPTSDLTIPSHAGEALVEYFDRLHAEVVRNEARAAFVVKATAIGWPTSLPPTTATGRSAIPTVYFYCESRTGEVIHGFWRVSGAGRAARLTECYKLRSNQPNVLMHRIICGPQ